MLRTIDRRLAAGAALVAITIMLGVNALAGDAEPVSSRVPSSQLPAASRRALAELTGLLRRGAATPSRVEYRFHRETPAGPLDGPIVDVNRPPDHLEASLGGIVGTRAGRRIVCSPGPSGSPVCSTDRVAEAAEGAGPLIDALRAVTDPGRDWYTVTSAPGVTVAGERARCYRAAATGRQRRDVFGTSTEWCLAADGLLLRTTIERSDSRDVTTAATVRRQVVDADLVSLLAPFGLR